MIMKQLLTRSSELVRQCWPNSLIGGILWLLASVLLITPPLLCCLSAYLQFNIYIWDISWHGLVLMSYLQFLFSSVVFQRIFTNI